MIWAEHNKTVLQKEASRYHWKGWKHYKRSNFEETLTNWRMAAMLRRQAGNNPAATTESRDLIGCVLRRMSDVSDNKRTIYLKRILFQSIRHELKGDQYNSNGKHRQAIKEYRKSIELEQTTIGLREHHPIITSLNQKIASIQQDMGECDQCVLLYCDALVM